jgi:hypothetical protein
MTRLYPAAPVLSAGAIGYSSFALSWTDISLRGIPVIGYQIWRGTGAAPQSFTLIGTTGQGVLTYTDSTVSPGTTYTYYVVGDYDVNRFTSWSNYITGTTLAFRYAYTMRGGGMDIYDFLVPASPANAATLTDANHNQGGNAAIVQVSDPTYIWINDGTTLYTYQWQGHELNPVLVNTMANAQNALVRRGVASRNNLLFIYNTNTAFIQSYDISNPASPSLISQQAAPSQFLGKNGFVYDPISNKLVAAFYNNFNMSGLFTLTVDAAGNLGSPQNIANLSPAFGLTLNMGFLYNGLYWVQSQFQTYSAWKIDGSGQGTGGGGLPGATYDFSGCAVKVKGNYAFICASASNVAHQAILVYDLRTWTLVASLGGTSNTCNSLMITGNMLIYAIGGVVSAYDITALLASGGAPVLLGSVTGPAEPNGLTGYISDQWAGQNGGCAV